MYVFTTSTICVFSHHSRLHELSIEALDSQCVSILSKETVSRETTTELKALMCYYLQSFPCCVIQCARTSLNEISVIQGYINCNGKNACNSEQQYTLQLQTFRYTEVELFELVLNLCSFIVRSTVFLQSDAVATIFSLFVLVRLLFEGGIYFVGKLADSNDG